LSAPGFLGPPAGVASAISAVGVISTVGAMEGFTTLMIRHIPRRLRAWDVVEELCGYLRPQDFDFVYVPGVAASETNMGYAFVNIPDPKLAQWACRHLDGRPWTPSGCERRMKVRPAFIQGLADNLKQFLQKIAHRLDTRLSHLPLVFDCGQRVPLEVALRTHCPTPQPAQLGSSPPPHAEFQAKVVTGIDYFESDDEGSSADGQDNQTTACASSWSTASSATPFEDNMGRTSSCPPNDCRPPSFRSLYALGVFQ